MLLSNFENFMLHRNSLRFLFFLPKIKYFFELKNSFRENNIYFLTHKSLFFKLILNYFSLINFNEVQDFKSDKN